MPKDLQARVESIVGVGGLLSPDALNRAIKEVSTTFTVGENDLTRTDLDRGATSVLGLTNPILR